MTIWWSNSAGVNIVMVKQHDEDVRRIQFSGKSSYMLALPKRWVEEMELRSGDQVTVSRESNSSLVITPTKDFQFRGRSEVTTEISQKDSAGSLVRRIVSLYLSGYSVIHIRSKEYSLTSTQRDIIKEAVRRHLVGTEVIADSTEGTTLQILISYPELNVENALRRMFLITASMHTDVIQALKRLDKDSARSVIKTDDEVDRFSIYVIRQLKLAVQSGRILKEIGLATSTDCLGYRLVVKNVERVADHACGIAQSVLLLNSPLEDVILEKISKMSEFALNLFEESGLALFKRDYNAADEVVEKTKAFLELERDLLTTMEKRRIKSYYVPRLIVADIRRTVDYASDISEIALNMTVEQALVGGVESSEAPPHV